VTLLTANHFVLSRTAAAIGPRDRLPGLADHEKSFMRLHFESIEVQDERRHRQPQIIQFFDPGVVPVLHGEFACGLRRAMSMGRGAWTSRRLEPGASTRPLTGGDGRRYVDAGNGRCGFNSPLNHGQLQHSHALPFTEQRHQHAASIRKFDRIMVPIRRMLIYDAEFSDAETGFLGPDPSVVVSDVLGECQFGSGQHADRDVGLSL
jgi:hypothetical protein